MNPYEIKRSIEINTGKQTLQRIEQGFLPDQEDSEIIQKRRRDLFNKVCNQTHWKMPTKDQFVSTHTEAEILADAIIHFVGGAEIVPAIANDESMKQLGFIVRSKGYYHYIGA